jgi:hypothetical protein
MALRAAEESPARAAQRVVLEQPAQATQQARAAPSSDPAERQADELGARIGADLGAIGGVGSGPLPSTVQGIAERHLGVSFAGAELRAGGDAHAKALSERALAVTEGSTISFRGGHLSTATPAGRALLGHELTHVAQQRAMGAEATQRAGADDGKDKGIKDDGKDKGGKEGCAGAVSSVFFGSPGSGPLFPTGRHVQGVFFLKSGGTATFGGPGTGPSTYQVRIPKDLFDVSSLTVPPSGTATAVVVTEAMGGNIIATEGPPHSSKSSIDVVICPK